MTFQVQSLNLMVEFFIFHCHLTVRQKVLPYFFILIRISLFTYRISRDEPQKNCLGESAHA